MKIIILGGTGLLGTHLVHQLGADHELVLFHTNRKNSIESTKSIIGDRLQLPDFRRQFERVRPEVVVDLISYTAYDALMLLQAFDGICPRVIVVSSGDVYEAYDSFRGISRKIYPDPLKETDGLRKKLFPYRGIDHQNPFTENYEKILVEEKIANQDSFDYTILRLGALYGARDRQLKLGEYIKPMLQQKAVLEIEKEKAQWRWTRLYAGNAAGAIQRVIEDTTPSRNQVFNLGERNACSQIELIEILKDLTSWRGEVVFIEKEKSQLNYRQHLILDTSKIRKNIKYSEMFSREEALANTIDYFKSL